MARTHKRRYGKYPSCFGKLTIGGIVKVARRHGMQVIHAYKPNMHVYNEVALYGTPDQMKAVEADWMVNGNELKPRSFRAVFGAVRDLPRDQWLSIPTTHRDYCRPNSEHGCTCDYEETR